MKKLPGAHARRQLWEPRLVLSVGVLRVSVRWVGEEEAAHSPARAARCKSVSIHTSLFQMGFSIPRPPLLSVGSWGEGSSHFRVSALWPCFFPLGPEGWDLYDIKTLREGSGDLGLNRDLAA